MSVDWVLVDAAGRIAILVDYKGSRVARGRGFDSRGAWSRGKRIIEAETGAKVIELERPDDALAIEPRGN